MELMFKYEDEMLDIISEYLELCVTKEAKMEFIKQHLRIAYHKGIDDVASALEECKSEKDNLENMIIGISRIKSTRKE